MARKITDKILQRQSKGTRPGKATSEKAIRDQYYLIRDDLLRLRHDIVKGYDMARSWVDKYGTVRSFLKAK